MDILIGDTVEVISNDRRRNYGVGIVTRFYEYGLFVRFGICSTCFSWDANRIRLKKPE